MERLDEGERGSLQLKIRTRGIVGVGGSGNNEYVGGGRCYCDLKKIGVLKNTWSFVET